MNTLFLNDARRIPPPTLPCSPRTARAPRLTPFLRRMGGLWLTLLVTLLLPLSAWSAEKVAMLNLTPRQLDPELVATFSKNLRESFLLDARFSMQDEQVMYRTLGGQTGQAQLKQARAFLAESKKLFKAGSFDAALSRLNEARALHRSVYSEVSRANELADVLFFQGLSLVELGKKEAAQISFLQMLLLAPDFPVEQLQTLPPPAQEALDAARRLERTSPMRGITANFATDIARRLEVSYLLAGVMDGRSPEDGGGATVRLVLFSPDKSQALSTLVFDLSELEEGVPPVGAPLYQRIVTVCSRYLTTGGAVVGTRK